MRHTAQVRHSIPGRLRMHLPDARHNTALLQQVAKSVGSMAGVKGVEVSPATGSVLIHYDGTRAPNFAAALADQGEGSELFSLTDTVEQEADLLAAHSELMRVFVNAVRELNENIKNATGHQMDLKVLAGLGGIALSILKQIEGTPLWVTLAIFTMHAHLDLQRQSAR